MKGSLSIMRLKLKYVIEDVDRHGNVRVYYRPPGHAKIRMREKLGTPEFLRELEAAKAEVFKPSGKRRNCRRLVDAHRKPLLCLCRVRTAGRIYQDAAPNAHGQAVQEARYQTGQANAVSACALYP